MLQWTPQYSIPIQEATEAAIKGSDNQGIRWRLSSFYCGCAMGFDMLAAEVALALQSELSGLQVIAVVPYRGQSERWNDAMKARYDTILCNSDDVIILSEHYYHGCLLRRNDYMVFHSSSLIAWYDGKPKGGTFYTYRKATANGLKVLNLYGSSIV